MNKNSPVFRQLDKLGRVTLPMELRQHLQLSPGDRIDISLDGQTILLQKHSSGCLFCGETRNIVEYRGLSVCSSCLAELRNIELSDNL